MPVSNTLSITNLRQRAEARCRDISANTAGMSQAEMQTLVHELQVHQIELEIQNEELRKTQGELERARDLYARLYHQAPAGYVSLDAGGRIQRANDTFASIIGNDAVDMIHQPFAGMIEPEDRRIFLSRYKAFFKFPEGKSIDVRLQNNTGGWLWARLEGRRDATARHEKKTKQENLLFMIVQDVTEQKQAEAQRLALQKRMMEAQKMESLGMMAGGVAHNFNNLLHVVLGNLDMARDGGPGAMDFVANAESAARRASELSQLMLTFVGQNPGVKHTVNIGSHFQRMLPLIKAALPDGVRLTAHFPENIPQVMADLAQIQQLIMNLVTNAAEAMEDVGGDIRLLLGLRQCDPKTLCDQALRDNLPEGRYVFLSVTDTGPGMDPQTLSRIFEPFFTTKFTGRGLGLAAALGIVRGHGGAIAVKSEPEKGAAVEVLLPALENEKTDNEDATKNPW